MRYSPNLNIIIKAIEKAANIIARDYSELENLQSNPTSAQRFADACYRKVKKVLFEDLSKMRPQYDIVFSDGESIQRGSAAAEYRYVIYPLDGVENFVRANPDFTVAIALEHVAQDGKKESISVAINKIVGNELYYCEKGLGAYLNNRRCRISRRSQGDEMLVFAEDKADLPQNLSAKKIMLRNYGASSLAIAYLSSAKLDGAVFAANRKDHDFLKPFFLLVKEAGGAVVEGEKGNLLV